MSAKLVRDWWNQKETLKKNDKKQDVVDDILSTRTRNRRKIYKVGYGNYARIDLLSPV